ncbi:MAG: hypothetical protein ABI051_14770, partial [Vicinamibacterales bacterium]
AAVAAQAQSTRRPDMNLFGRALRDPQQSLAVRGNLGATFYDALGKRLFDPNGVPAPDHGWGSFATGALIYNLSLANITFDGSLGGFATYYPNQARKFRTNVTPGAGAHTGWTRNLSDKTRLNVSSGLSLGSLSAEAILPGGPGGLGIDTGFGSSSDATSAFLPQQAAFVKGTRLSLFTGASLTHELSRRFNLTGDYQIRKDTSFGGEGQPLGLWGQTVGAALHFAVTRNLSVRGGYIYGETHRKNDDRIGRTHSADIGVDYNRGAVLQLTRRTTLAFNGGASGYVDRAGTQHYRLIGNASLNHQMGRTWISGVDYTRGLDSNQLLFQEPLLNDTLTARMNGLISRRLGFHSEASVQHGSVGFARGDNDVVRSVADAGLQFALGRHYALGADYTYYRYNYSAQVARPLGLPTVSASQGVHVFLSAWAPIFQRGGRNASR